MYCFDQPSVSTTTTTFFPIPTIDHLIYQPQIAQQSPPLMHHQTVSTYQPMLLDYTNNMSPLLYYEEEAENQPNGLLSDQIHSPESSVFSPNSISSTTSSYGESTIKAQDLLSMSDLELEKLSIRQLNSVLAFGVSYLYVDFSKTLVNTIAIDFRSSTTKPFKASNSEDEHSKIVDMP